VNEARFRSLSYRQTNRTRGVYAFSAFEIFEKFFEKFEI